MTRKKIIPTYFCMTAISLFVCMERPHLVYKAGVAADLLEAFRGV
jgi:hypothetical protein